MRKNFFLGLFIIVLLLSSLFICSRYGWKLFGFKYCADPSNITVTTIEIDNNTKTTKLSGNTSESAPAFVGYIYKVENNTLYVGMKYNILFGFIERDGSFDIQIPADSCVFEKIIIMSESNKKTVWEKGNPQ